jgi:FMN phosphatase YigB (HAD superfamily)
MTVAIVHYHLGPGGVSTVIAAASRCLTAEGIAHVILAGSGVDGLPVRVVPELNYGADVDAEVLLERLRAAASEALGRAPDVWHFHNHSLGKNAALPGVVARMAEDGERIVLQIHDLAEEGRPGNYRAIADCGKLYPVSERMSYAFVNSRDREVFVGAGLDEGRALLLENPVAVADGFGRNEFRAPIVFAPARGIRRKNLGEMVFLSALAPAGARFAVSRAPLDERALAIHETWRKFAGRQGLPIAFDVVDRFAPEAGAAADFKSWIAHASHFVTTSVAEGFGLTFLEAAAHGKPLIGRKLAHIAADHARHGIRAGDLYERLLVPAEWIDESILRDHLHTTLERNHRLLGRPLTRDDFDATYAAMFHDDWLDFGNLPEPLQQGAIERAADPSCRKIPRVLVDGETRPADAWLAEALDRRAPSVAPEQLAPYSMAEYGKSLISLYMELCGRQPSPVRFLAPSAVLDAFLGPQSFHFLLSAPPPKSAPWAKIKAVVFDIYGTLLIAPAGGVKPDPTADLLLRDVLRQFGHEPPESPSAALHEAVLRHHAAAGVPFPEIDLRVLWREVLSLDPDEDVTSLVIALENVWHPSVPMPGAAAFVLRLARTGVSLGLLSNGQCNTLRSLGEIRDFFAPELTLLSYQHGVAKPDPALFEMMAERLAGRGISRGETVFIGNDPLQDIVPAATAGFKTALFTGHPDARRPGDCRPDFELDRWPGSEDMRG